MVLVVTPALRSAASVAKAEVAGLQQAPGRGIGRGLGDGRACDRQVDQQRGAGQQPAQHATRRTGQLVCAGAVEPVSLSPSHGKTRSAQAACRDESGREDGCTWAELWLPPPRELSAKPSGLSPGWVWREKIPPAGHLWIGV